VKISAAKAKCHWRNGGGVASRGGHQRNKYQPGGSRSGSYGNCREISTAERLNVQLISAMKIFLKYFINI